MLHTLNYARQVAESRRGTLLLPRASFHITSNITHLLRVALPSEARPAPVALSSGRPAQRRTALLWTATDGSLGFIATVEEGAFRRLDFLATKMVAGVPHACGLHPRALRAHQTHAGSSRELKSMLDTSLLGRFLHLSALEQQRLALQIGSTPKKVLAALEAIRRGMP